MQLGKGVLIDKQKIFRQGAIILIANSVWFLMIAIREL